MADVDVMPSLQQLQQLQPGSAPGSPPPFLDPITGPTTAPDGAQVFSTAINLGPTVGSGIPIGTWKLRLTDDGGQARLPVRALFEANGDFRSVEVDFSRFELEADPNHLVAADLEVPGVTAPPQVAVILVDPLGRRVTSDKADVN